MHPSREPFLLETFPFGTPLVYWFVGNLSGNPFRNIVPSTRNIAPNALIDVAERVPGEVAGKVPNKPINMNMK